MRPLQIIKLKLPANSVKMTGELGAILGQHNLNIMKFCTDFNNESKKFPEGVPLKTKVLVMPGNAYEIKIDNISLNFLLLHYSDDKVIKPLQLVKIACIVKSNVKIFQTCKSIAAYLDNHPEFILSHE